MIVGISLDLFRNTMYYSTSEFQALQLNWLSSRGVWCRGLTTRLLYVGPFLGNLVENDSRFVGFTTFCCFIIASYFNAAHIYLYSWYVYALFTFCRFR